MSFILINFSTFNNIPVSEEKLLFKQRGNHNCLISIRNNWKFFIFIFY